MTLPAYNKTQTTPNKPSFIAGLFADYSRQQALLEGILIDVTTTAQQLGYPCTVAISGRLFDQCVKWDSSDTVCQLHQDQTVRLKNLLTVAKTAARLTGPKAHEAAFALAVVIRDGYSVGRIFKPLKIILERDSHEQLALTILLKHDLHQALLDFKHTSAKKPGVVL